MHEHMEPNESHQYPIDPYRQLRFGQLNGKENRNDGKNVRQISHQPMQPIEQWPILVRRCRSEHGRKRLNEAQQRSDGAQNGVRILFARPTANLNENDNETGNGQWPSQHHERTMPGKPLIFAAQRTAHPRLLKVAGQQNANRSGSNPGGQHEASMQAKQQIWFSRHFWDVTEQLRTARHNATNVMVSDIICYVEKKYG